MLANKIGLSIIGVLLSSLMFIGLNITGVNKAEANQNLNNGVFVLAMGANTHGLTQANADAKRFADTMRIKFSIPASNIAYIPDATKYAFENAINDFLAGKPNKQKVYVYFSGHGIKMRGGNASECYDEALIFKDRKYRDDFFVNQLNRINTPNLVTILDTCFSGGMIRASCPGAKPKATPFLSSCGKPTRIKKLKGLVLTASQENQMAWEYPGKGGRFTNALLYYINKADLSRGDAFRSAFRSARAKIIHETKGTGCEQRPQLFAP